jgi:uncharacterized membrane protein
MEAQRHSSKVWTSLYNGRPIIGRWTLKEALQGKPLGHPSHALMVHFPGALLPTAFVFDVISRIGGDNSFVRAAFYDIAVGLLVALAAVVTGLVDYLPMVQGSTKRRLGTSHLRAQVTAVSLFFVSFLLRAGDLDADETAWAPLILAGAGAAVLALGNFFGGELVYRQGMRVSTDL